MTGAAALTLLMSRLGNRTETDLRALCLSEMIMAQQTLVEGGDFLPWFTLKDSVGLVTVAATRQVAVPADFIRENDEHPLFYVASDGKYYKLDKMELEEAMQKWGATADGAPSDYCLIGSNYEIFPLPDDVYSLAEKYHYSQALPADDSSETTWLKWAPDLMIAAAGFNIATLHLQDPEMGTVFAAQIAQANARLMKLDIARQEAAQTRRMG